MLTRRHEADGRRSVALYSDCEAYRYRLTRRWAPDDTGPGTLAFIMLNPSTADERRNDPTIARCESRARALGYGGVDIVNLFALRATRPADLKRAAAPEGPENRRVLRQAAEEAACIVAAWGVHGAHLGQEARVRDWLAGLALVALGETKAGHPRHPLYVPSAAPLRPWPAP
jgi:hypothetical protein